MEILYPPQHHFAMNNIICHKQADKAVLPELTFSLLKVEISHW